MNSNPCLAITIGDPSGIGLEVVLKALDHLKNEDFSAVIVGERPADQAPLIKKWTSGISIKQVTPPTIDPAHQFQWIELPNHPNSVRQAIDTAHQLCIDGITQGMVTAPISKSNMQQSGAPFWDHTSYLGHLNRVSPTMAFFAPPFCVSLATVHCPLKEVTTHLTQDRLHRTIFHTWTWLRSLKIKTPRLGIAGVNPHAGENGLMGDEETRILIPCIHSARHHGITISDPKPGDTIFWEAAQGRYDAVIAMYHDQGLAPLKLIAFDKAVNTTLGLPYVRTSPDHGTAPTIAYKDIANPNSMIAAIQLAIRTINGN